MQPTCHHRKRPSDGSFADLQILQGPWTLSLFSLFLKLPTQIRESPFDNRSWRSQANVVAHRPMIENIPENHSVRIDPMLGKNPV
jgi:hypothetical protein